MKNVAIRAYCLSTLLLGLATYGVSSSPAYAGADIAAPDAASVPHFRFSTYAVRGALQTWLTGVNDAGVIVGWFIDRQGNAHGLRLVNGKMTQIDDPSGTNTQVFGINSVGAIVGSYVTPCLEELCFEGFVYENGRFADVGPPTFLNEDDRDDAPDSVAYAIADNGDVVGFGGDGFGGGYGFSRHAGMYRTIEVPGANDAIAVGVNASGLITVNWATNTTFEASLYDGSTFTNIDVPAAKESFAGAVNNHGDVVLAWGSIEGDFLRGALRRRDGKYFRFYDPRGTRDTFPFGINDGRMIVGAYSPGGTHSIHVYGFVATYSSLSGAGARTE